MATPAAVASRVLSLGTEAPRGNYHPLLTGIVTLQTT